MNAQILAIISLVLSGLAIIAGIYAIIAISKVRTWRRWFSDSNEHPENLEQIITSIATKIKALQSGQALHTEQLSGLKETLSFAVQQTGIVRYNSQADDGGNLSFSLALLDAHRSGFVITSLHGRQQNRIYSKRIVNGESEVPLSDEERDAVFAAIKPLAKIEPVLEAKTISKNMNKLKAAKPTLKRKPVKV
jgi:hypothetical protein